MSQKARQGLFIHQILLSSASTKEDSFEAYTHLELEIVFCKCNIDSAAAEDAKPLIESRLRTPIIVDSFKRLLRAYGEEISEAEFIDKAIKYLQKTRSLIIKTLGPIGVSLPNQYIVIDEFRAGERDYLRKDAIFMVFLHQLGHSLLHRHENHSKNT